MSLTCFNHSLHPFIEENPHPEQTAEANEKYAMAKWLLANRETELATAQLQELEKNLLNILNAHHSIYPCSIKTRHAKEAAALG